MVGICADERGNYDPVANSLVQIEAAGEQSVTANMLQAGYQFTGEKYYAKLLLINTPDDGGPVVTNWSAATSAALSDSGKFILVKAGTWKEPGTWSGPEESEYGNCYPGYGASCAIADNLNGTVEIDGTVYVSWDFFKTGQGHSVTFRGTDANARIVHQSSSRHEYFTGTNVFDRIAIEVKTDNGFATYHLGDRFSVINQASVTLRQKFTKMSTAVEIAAGGTLVFNNNGAITMEAAGSFAFKGKSPRLELNNTFDASADGTPFNFSIPAEGYEAAPVNTATSFPKSGKVVVNLPPKRELELRTGSLKECDIPLIYSSAGLDQEKIAFGFNPLPKPCAFVYSGDGKTLYYHYKRSRSLVVIVR